MKTKFEEINNMLTTLNRHQSLVLAARLVGFNHITMVNYTNSIETAIFCNSGKELEMAHKLAIKYGSGSDEIREKDMTDNNRECYFVELKTELH